MPDGPPRDAAAPAGLRILEPLGSGFTARVDRALDAAGRAVALKRPRPGLDALGRRRFEREARLGAGLRHPRLAAQLAAGPGWIVSELLAGSLRERLAASPPLPPAEVRPLLAALAEALAYLHARGVVHRDLKPAHVMFRGAEAVLIDLGVAGLAAEDPLEGAELVGSPAWMAPEQALGAPPDPAADVWSLAALGAALLSGRPPFAGSAEDVLAGRRRGDEPGFDLAVLAREDRDLARLIVGGLAPRPAERPAAAAFLALGSVS